ncbi:unnamed protein product [Hydatigera taeniaeformis]|uniref:Replication stress response regulator SDE2 n=1 Tax=Hydatigena taeniaeformis TaxID=6205 RepID=A0A0R3WLU0_HYDTA|nr:unnamed protein product [Hydatigera taeniaeformis]
MMCSSANVTERRFITRKEYLVLFNMGVDCYFSVGGRLINHPSDVEDEETLVQVHPRLRGGKGGFGSMLRAIGNQIEKTNNHDMCRDLSGRRMRDVNAEAKLKEWYAKAGERERAKVDRYLEKQRRRREALDKGLLHDHKFNDPDFAKRKEHISAELQDAVEAMLSQVVADAASSEPAKKKAKLWIEQLDEDVSSSNDDGSDGNDSDDSSPLDLTEKEDHIAPSLESIANSETNLEFVSNKENDEKVTEQVVLTEEVLAESQNEGNVTMTSEKEVSPVTGRPSEAVSITDSVLDAASSAVELESYGLEVLKQALSCRGLKCGGTLSERANRLFSVRGLDPSQYPAKILAKPSRK